MLVLLAAACARASPAESVGLFTSLPIQWREAQDIREHLSGAAAPPHWALAVLRARGAVRPLDSFLPDRDGSPLKGVTMLVMAQPRALAPQENVALDGWVRQGGRLLLFADPMLTADSRFSLGDRRRPEDVAMLSPILARWGLRLEFDEDQAAGEREVPLLGLGLPVNLPGRLAPTAKGARCAVLSGGMAARCAIGRGRVLVVADAALFEDGAGQEDAGRRARVLERLLGAI